jgi:hypothetical protein
MLEVRAHDCADSDESVLTPFAGEQEQEIIYREGQKTVITNMRVI